MRAANRFVEQGCDCTQGSCCLEHCCTPMTIARSLFGWGSHGQLLRPGQHTDHSGCRQQNAMHVEEPDFDYYHNLATKLQYDLEHNKHRDAFAEVMVLKYNILHAFMESAEHPHQVHGRPNLIPEVRTIDTASDNVGLCFASAIFVQRVVCIRCCRYACSKEMPVDLKLGPSLKDVLWHCLVSFMLPSWAKILPYRAVKALCPTSAHIDIADTLQVVSQCSLVLNGVMCRLNKPNGTISKAACCHGCTGIRCHGVEPHHEKARDPQIFQIGARKWWKMKSNVRLQRSVRPLSCRRLE